MSSQYKLQLPSPVAQDPAIVQFFEDFYATSDTPDAHEKYATMFTDDATFVLGNTKATGSEEILNLRKGMWSAVRAIYHPLLKLFPFGANATEFMVCGTVSYEFKEGGSVSKDWAGRAELVKEGEGWKLRMYQVYLDTAAPK